MFKKRLVVGIIDDDSAILNAMWRLLEAHGFDAEVFGSLQEFLDVLPVTDARLIIVDVHLSGESCIELVRRMAASGVALPVILMTANDDEEIGRQALQVDCVAILTKPVPADDLIRAVNDALFPN